MINLATENKVWLRAVVGLKFIAFNPATAHTLTVGTHIGAVLLIKMSSTWDKLRNNITKILFPTKEERSYLTELLDNLKQAQRSHESLSFEIKSVKRTGFIVKVKGLFAFVSFYYMPWEYKSLECWRAVSKHLIGSRFWGTVYSISEGERPIKILLNAESHKFSDIVLIPSEEYECVIIQKIKYGLVVDLGYHFHWKYGSLQGFIHKSTYSDDTTLLDSELGEIITTRFHGLKRGGTYRNGGLILGNNNVKKEFLTGELDYLIGTIRPAILKEDERGKRVFFIDGKFKTVINIPVDIFPSQRIVKKKIKKIRNV